MVFWLVVSVAEYLLWLNSLVTAAGYLQRAEFGWCMELDWTELSCGWGYRVVRTCRGWCCIIVWPQCTVRVDALFNTETHVKSQEEKH